MRAWLFIPVVMIVCCTGASVTHAQDESRWSKEVEGAFVLMTEPMEEPGFCREIFDRLWRPAKQGNLIARSYLALLSAPLPHMQAMVLPGRAIEDETRLKDALILSAHALKAIPVEAKGRDAESLREIYQDFTLMHVESEWWAHVYPDQKSKYTRDGHFMKCLAYNGLVGRPVELCTEEAVEKGFLPSFSAYAAEIDKLLAEGAQPRCYSGGGPNDDRRIAELFEEEKTIAELSALSPVLGEGITFAESEQGGRIGVAQLTDPQGREFLIRNVQSSYSCGNRGCSTDFFRKDSNGSYKKLKTDLVTLPPYYLKTCGDSVSLLLYGGGGLPDRYPEWGYDEASDQFTLMRAHETRVQAESCPTD